MAARVVDEDVPGTSLARAMLDLLGCVVDGKGAVYVSTPITTGRLFVSWRLGRGRWLTPGTPEYGHQLLLHVVEPNRRDAEAVVHRTREAFGSCVIDPSRLPDVDLPGWSQACYHFLWADAIERYVRAIVFRDGWQFSTGCILEFHAGAAQGLELLDEELKPFTAEDGERLIEEARTSLAEEPMLQAFAATLGQLSATR